MSGEPDVTTASAAVAMADFMSTLQQILLDQRKINVVLTSLLKDQQKRLKELEDREIAPAAVEGPAPRAGLVIGKDVPAYSSSDLEFLKRCQVFEGLSDEALRVVYYFGDLQKCGKGHILFEIGSPSDSFCVVKTGVVEIQRPMDNPDEMKTVAFFTNSDSIGEMRIITESPHRSRGRMPGGGEILIVTRMAFMDMMEQIPELAIRMTEMYAHKLEGTVSSLRRHEETAQPLEGSLEFFDLATVIQTLLSTDQRTGQLTVSDDKQQMVAELFVDNGKVLQASMGHITGEDAFYQLFLRDMNRGTFFFEETAAPEDASGDEIEIPGMSLMMEAARLHDELEEIKASLIPDPEQRFARKADALTWDEEEPEVLAEAIFRAVATGQNVRQMVGNLPTNEHQIYSILMKLIQSDQIA